MMCNFEKNKLEIFVILQKKLVKKSQNDIIKRYNNIKEVFMQYKLVAIDIDGTLLNSRGEVSEENKKSIQNAIKNGVKVVLSSRKIIRSNAGDFFRSSSR
jgi:L-asparaginase/Glu-tRNA(Gln) amidotransferase subunit D